ncbi:TPA: hypothetical protein DCX15_01090 [bacterium]|nr:hypothetical protein [bacterium]
MSNIICPLCKRCKGKFSFTGKDLLYNINGRFDLFECKNCGLVFLNPIPSEDDLKDYYPKDYCDEYGRLTKILVEIMEKGRAKKIVKISRIEAKILDVGCGRGYLLRALNLLGARNLYGVEPDPDAAKLASRFGVIKVSTFLNAQLKDNSFDIVIFKHSLEHIPNIEKAIEKTKRILRHDGMVVVILPNSNSWERRIFGKYWRGFDVPRHIYTFNPFNLDLLLRNNGFRIKEMRYGFTPNDWIMSIQFYLSDKLPSLKPFFSINNPFLLMLFAPLSIIQSLAMKSGRMEITAQRCIN